MSAAPPRRRRPPRVLTALIALLTPCAAPADDVEWVTVGDPGNPCGNWFHECRGVVEQVYRIAKTEITNAQYAAFLNAVAADDANALYNPQMGAEGGPGDGSPRRTIEGRARKLGPAPGGIGRSGSPGSFTYHAIEGREKKPVTFVSFWDALRFVNWLHNGRPVGAQDDTTTEDGAYTLTESGLASGGIERNADVARVFLPSWDEWYKAAYYDTESRTWFEYPAGTNEVSTCAPPGDTPNTANCGGVVGDLTDVGSYTASASPNGTYDQGGNVFEWNEGVYQPSPPPPHRMLKGGSYHRGARALRAAGKHRHFSPEYEGRAVGFRVASRVPPADAVDLTRIR